MSDGQNPVFTVGHSNHPIESFVRLLRSNDISAVADVRSAPRSRMNPQFDQQDLRLALRDAGISYVFLGVELGARSSNRACYIDGRADYDLISRTDEFRLGIDRILTGSHTHRIALMCAEKEPLECHRTILVTRHLVGSVEVNHIHADGTLESHDDAMSRLLRLQGVSEADLFQSPQEKLTAAYQRQGLAIAYVDERNATPTLTSVG